MSTCSKVFLDIDGRPSELYYNIEKTKGPQAAKKAYIEYMMGINPKFSIGGKIKSDIDSLLRTNKNLRLSKDEKHYINKNGARRNRATSVIDSFIVEPKKKRGVTIREAKGEFDVDGIATLSAENEQKNFILSSQFDGKMPNQVSDFEDAVREFRNEHPNDLKERIDLIKKSWEASADWGTHFHMVFQKVLEARNKILDKDPEAEIHPYDLITAARGAMGKKFMIGVSQTDYTLVIKDILKEIDLIEKDLGKVRVLPELKVEGKALNFAGTADVVLINDKGEFVIMDFKSKTHKSVHNFDSARGAEFGGPLEGEYLRADPATKARVQMSLYASALVEAGFIPSRREAIRTVVLQGRMEYNKDSKEFAFRSLYVERIDRTTSLHNVLLGENTPEVDREKMQDEGAYGFVNNVANVEADHENLREGTNLSYMHYSEDKAIERKLAQYNRDPETGRRYVFRNNPNEPSGKKLYIDDFTPEQVDKILRDDYKEMKRDQLRMPADLKTYFNQTVDKDGKLIGKQVFSDKKMVSVRALLKDITPETHRLMTGLEYDPEVFGDLGRDVLVAENRETGAISLISAINVDNNSISFHSDGSKCSR
jgi:hypothetical protein